tara:strand:+ start:154 stop:375 length:222 start_codon:yes stop_codon:yes gene_type:complete
MRKQLVNALKDKYRAEYSTAHASLNIYLNNPVGIGEHPQHIEEMDKWIEQMTSARDKLEVLEKEYPEAILMTE